MEFHSSPVCAQHNLPSPVAMAVEFPATSCSAHDSLAGTDLIYSLQAWIMLFTQALFLLVIWAVYRTMILAQGGTFKTEERPSGDSDRASSVSSTKKSDDKEKRTTKGQEACGQYLKRWQLWCVVLRGLSLPGYFDDNRSRSLGIRRIKTGSLTTPPTCRQAIRLMESFTFTF